MSDRGILCRGVVLADTERVIRDPAAWWTAGRETRPRRWPIDLLVAHWTAGPPREGPTAGRLLFRAMEARRGQSGDDLSVSVHFSISWDGMIWQHLDLADAAVHVGHRPTLARSIGVECMWPGTAAQAAKIGADGEAVLRRIDGAAVRAMRPSDALLDAWRWLAEALARGGADGLEIPRKAAPADRRLTAGELARTRGAIEHLHVTGTTKIDAAGLLVAALGWPDALA